MVTARHTNMVGREGVEPSTSRLSGVRSNHLSYRPPRRQSRQSRALWRCLAALAVLARGANSFAVCARAAHSRMKGHEDGGYVLRQKRSSSRRSDRSLGSGAFVSILRKEVIQPQVPLRLPCYDFTPVAEPTVASCLLAVSSLSSGQSNSHGVTGGVYKAWVRIHRGMLIHDY